MTTPDPLGQLAAAAAAAVWKTPDDALLDECRVEVAAVLPVLADLIEQAGEAERLCNQDTHDDRSCLHCGLMQDGYYGAADFIRSLASNSE